MKLGIKISRSWFVKPIEILNNLPEGDGSFAIIMIALPLYERFIVAKLKLEGKPTGEENVREEIALDLKLSSHERSIFWEIFRNGFMHQGMGKDGKTKWMINHSFGHLPEFKTLNGINYVCLNPYKFAIWTIDKFKNDQQLITASESFPLADVFSEFI